MIRGIIFPTQGRSLEPGRARVGSRCRYRRMSQCGAMGSSPMANAVHRACNHPGGHQGLAGQSGDEEPAPAKAGVWVCHRPKGAQP